MQMGRSDPLHFVDMEKIQEKIERRGEMEKDKLWNRMLDMQIVGMTREDLENDNGIVSELARKL